jgi:hypothetical protein
MQLCSATTSQYQSTVLRGRKEWGPLAFSCKMNAIIRLEQGFGVFFFQISMVNKPPGWLSSSIIAGDINIPPADSLGHPLPLCACLAHLYIIRGSCMRGAGRGVGREECCLYPILIGVGAFYRAQGSGDDHFKSGDRENSLDAAELFFPSYCLLIVSRNELHSLPFFSSATVSGHFGGIYCSTWNGTKKHNDGRVMELHCQVINQHLILQLHHDSRRVVLSASKLILNLQLVL